MAAIWTALTVRSRRGRASTDHSELGTVIEALHSDLTRLVDLARDVRGELEHASASPLCGRKPSYPTPKRCRSGGGCTGACEPSNPDLANPEAPAAGHGCSAVLLVERGRD